jgi:outer membrane translocation and assembly module TamA
MGNVFSSIGDISFRVKQRDLQDFNFMAHAAGFGIRYKTPVGPVRLDLSYVLNPADYLGFGGTAQELLSCNPNAPPASQPGYCTSTRQSSGHLQFFFSIGQTF